MALATSDEIRVVDLETKMAALMDYVDEKLDFDARAYVEAKIIEHTP